MPAGRPNTSEVKFPLFNDLSMSSDGLYCLSQQNIKSFYRQEFKSEKDFSAYFELNIDLFVDEYLDGDYVSHRKEFELINFNKRKGRGRSGGSKRVDYYIKTTKGHHFIELKHTTFESEINTAIGQLLNYSTLASVAGIQIKRLFLLTTKFSLDSALTIKRFNLPITVFLINKDQHLIFNW